MNSGLAVLQLPVKYPQLPAFLIGKIEILIRCISHLSFCPCVSIRRENNALNSLGVVLILMEQLLSECVCYISPPPGAPFTTVIWF